MCTYAFVCDSAYLNLGKTCRRFCYRRVPFCYKAGYSSVLKTWSGITVRYITKFAIGVFVISGFDCIVAPNDHKTAQSTIKAVAVCRNEKR